MELQPITPDSLDDEALTDLIEIRKSGVDHHASEGNKVQHAIQSLTLIALVELQQRRDADSSDPIYQWRERYEEGSLWDDCTKAQYDGFAKKTDCEIRILYTAPPAPVVPDEMVNNIDNPYGDEDLIYEQGKIEGWNSCRAAMLQAGNSPVTLDTWIPVSERMPDNGGKSREFYLCFGTYFDGGEPDYIPASFFIHPDNGWSEWEPVEDDCDPSDVIITHWMPLPAAPQKEVKSALEHGMQRYAGAMQKLSEGDK